MTVATPRSRVLDDEVDGAWRVLDYPTTPRAGEEVETLVSTVDELLRGMKVAADTDLGRLVARTYDALASVRNDAGHRTAPRRPATSRTPSAPATSTVAGYSWAAIGIAALALVAAAVWAPRKGVLPGT
jgi:ElaB/YqjD/DUF883 family membrane-anchored ribosome-binding protein